MLFSARSERLGDPMLVGRVGREDLQATFKAIREAGFVKASRWGYTVPDGGYTTIGVRTNGEWRVHAWHEYLLPGFGGNINTDAAYRAFVHMWVKTSGAIASLPPLEAHRLDEQLKGEAQFRGYNPGEPWKTEWVRKATQWSPPR